MEQTLTIGPPDRRRLGPPPAAQLVQATVANAYGLTRRDLLGGRGGARTALARQVAMYLLHVVFALSFRAIARGFDRGASTVCHAIQRVEAMRDEPEIDRTVARLEAVLRKLAAEATP